MAPTNDFPVFIDEQLGSDEVGSKEKVNKNVCATCLPHYVRHLGEKDFKPCSFANAPGVMKRNKLGRLVGCFSCNHCVQNGTECLEITLDSKNGDMGTEMITLVKLITLYRDAEQVAWDCFHLVAHQFCSRIRATTGYLADKIGSDIGEACYLHSGSNDPSFNGTQVLAADPASISAAVKKECLKLTNGDMLCPRFYPEA